MKKTLLLFFCISINFICFGQKNILVYTHNGEGYVHDNIEASIEALKKLAASNDWKLTASDDPEIFTKGNLDKMDLIIFSNTNNEAFYKESQRKAFQDFIESGKAFVGIHISTGSEREWPWFWEMQGGKFKSHPEFQSFTIKVINPNHPATAFLKSSFEWEDECYYFNQLNPAIDILLVADLTTIEDPNKRSYPGDIFGIYTPLAWTNKFEGSRIFYTALGHSITHYADPLFLEHLENGIKWTLNEE